MNGRVWHDADFDAIADDAERKLPGLDRRALSE